MLQESQDDFGPIYHYDTVDSTMHAARRLAREGVPHGTTVVADAQHAGRGRHGRTWFSPPGAGLWLTILWRPCEALGKDQVGNQPLPPLHSLSLVAGLAIHRAVTAIGAGNVTLKWPNDLEARGRKLAGILLEGDDLDTPSPAIRVGVGLNLARAADLTLPYELAERYLGLTDLLAKNWDCEPLRQHMLRACRAALWQHYALWRYEGLAPILQAWQHFDALKDQKVQAEGAHGLVVGRADGFGPEGQLRLCCDSKTLLIQAGEVQKVRGTVQ